MENIILYHGSEKIIKKPQYGVGKIFNDYGRCFYCTEDKNMAFEWAVDIGRDGYANIYEIDLSNLKLLDLCDEKYSVINWMAVLVANRRFDIQTDFGKEARQYLLDNFLPQLDEYDIIRGYRADDSYFSFAQDFLNNTISVRTLAKAMNLGKLGTQIAVKSQTAFDKINYCGYEAANASVWYPLKAKRDALARADYKKMRSEKWQRGETYMMQILEQEIKADDVRLRPDITL